MKHRYLLLLTPLLLPATLAGAQSSGVHVAPGKPLRVQRGLPAPYGPANPASAPPILPRFWRTADSASRVAQQQQYLRAMRLRYPAVALRESVGGQFPSGRFTFRLIVGADGVPQAPVLVQRVLTLAESAYNPSTVQALEDEANRVLSKLRFEPGSTVDTLLIPLTFNPPFDE